MDSNQIRDNERTVLLAHAKFGTELHTTSTNSVFPPCLSSTYQTASKSTSFAVEYSHVAVTMVLKMRSFASGSVLYSSWMKSVKADCVVFNTRRSRSPPMILGPAVLEEILTL